MNINHNSKQIDFKPANKKLEDVLFDVADYHVFAKSTKETTLFNEELPAKQYKALVNLNNNQVLSVVSQNYDTISNREALIMGKYIFCKLFPGVREEDLIPYKVIACQSLTTCHIDLIHKEVKFEKWEQDVWLPFVRISNSFNRTAALSFELGFVRKLCSNGFIFQKDIIRLKYSHIKGQIPSVLNIDISGFKKYEADFMKYLNRLSEYRVNVKFVFPLVLKALDLHFRIDHENPKTAERERKRLALTREIIHTLTDQYFSELKPSA